MKWYIKIALLFCKSYEVVEVTSQYGWDLTTTVTFKDFNGRCYALKTDFKTKPQAGKQARKLRRRNGK